MTDATCPDCENTRGLFETVETDYYIGEKDCQEVSVEVIPCPKCCIPCEMCSTEKWEIGVNGYPQLTDGDHHWCNEMCLQRWLDVEMPEPTVAFRFVLKVLELALRDSQGCDLEVRTDVYTGLAALLDEIRRRIPQREAK